MAYLAYRYRRDGLLLQFWPAGLRQLAPVLSLNFISKTVSTIIGNVDLLLINHRFDNYEVVHYSLSRRGPDVARMAFDRIGSAFNPALAHVMGAGELSKAFDNIRRLVNLLLWAALMAMGGVLVFNQTFILLWTGKAFGPLTGLNLTIAVSMVVLIFTKTFTDLCWALGELQAVSRIGIAQSLLTAGLLWGLTRLWPIHGLVVAPALSGAVVVICFLLPRLERQLQAPAFARQVMLPQLFRSLLALVPAMAVGWILPHARWGTLIASSVTFCVVYLAVLAALSGEFREECRPWMNRIRGRTQPA
jgi:O-antigen/teichoic acid export membrane protein